MIDQSSPYAGTSPVASLTGDATVTLVEGRTFALSGQAGDLTDVLPHGLFMLDVRVLSCWELRINGERLEPLAVHLEEPYAATFVGRGHATAGQADADIVVFRHRHVGGGMRERIVVTNHGLQPAGITVEVRCDADFASLFEVKERRVRPGRPRSLHIEPDALRFEFRDGDTARTTTVRTTGDAAVAPGFLSWQPTIAPGESWEACLDVWAGVDDGQRAPLFGCGGHDPLSAPARRMREWRSIVPGIDTDNTVLALTAQRSAEDLGALRIFDPEHPDLAIVAAGAPWFMTLFGRDALLTGWMSLLADPSLARGVLETLARFQGADVDDITEEEPGKILHETRGATTGAIAQGRGDIYYGSIDATPLFVMLLGELRRWAPNDEVADRLLPHADRALAWIEEFGDRDGDGYVEYQRRTERGLANQGWKDSWDAIRHPDGPLARGPIALCEVQGYVYAAYLARAHFAEDAGDHVTFERCLRRAEELRRRFNEDFWIDELGTYALGLDADKRPIAAVASNVGHCLWTGIVDPERAPSVADRLLDPSMFSGWGVRTLATSMRAYNPVSYHNGSVWPHDNALCAAGLARYGLVEHAHRIITAQLDVAAAHQGRLPELFAGFGRGQLAVPASYPASCSPQAWAAASPLLWLRTILRLDPWASRGALWLDPQLPASIGRLCVSGIAIGDQRLTVEVEGDEVEVRDAGDLTPTIGPRPPLTTLPIVGA